MEFSKLLEDGVLVYPVFNFEENKILHDRFISMINELPEFKDNNELKVLGGFGALSTASSFHHPFVRELRNLIYNKVNHIFKNDKRNLEFIIDRVMYRLSHQSPTGESWHRDESPDSLIDDIIFGGFVNFDVSEDQYFSCITR